MSSEKMAEKTFRPMLTYADGVHRLSSLIAWLNDDYGDGIISRKFYDGNIPEEQLLIANKTRKYIKKR